MRDMSKAVRQELQSQGVTLRDIPTDVLSEYAHILQAYVGDLNQELERRVIERAGEADGIAKEV